MEVRVHRLVQTLLQPATPPIPPGGRPQQERVIAHTQPLERDLLDLSSVAATASGIPAVMLPGDRPVVETHGLLLPLNQQMTIRRGWSNQNTVVIQQQGSDIFIQRRDGRESLLQRGDNLWLDHENRSHSTVVTTTVGAVSVNRPGINDDVQVERSGERILVDRLGAEQDMVLEQRGQRLEVGPRSNPARATVIEQTGSDWRIDRPGTAQDFTVRKQNNGFRIDRAGIENDVTVTTQARKITVDADWGIEKDFHIYHTADKVHLDRYGSEQDVTIRRIGSSLEIDRPGTANDLRIDRSGSELTLRYAGRRNNEDVTISGVTGTYRIQEAGLTIAVLPEALVLQSVQLDAELDLMLGTKSKAH
jgi:hypothetical protein